MSNQPARTPLPLAAADCHTPLVSEPLTAEQSERLAPSFKALGDPIRLRLLSLIASHQGGEACVCDLTDAFAVSAPTVSHHLKVLRESGLVASERRGTWVYYRAEPAALDLLSTVLSVPRRAGA
ncbi:ArsR/SmtB family transcription factor [Glycomyces terrestris]|uniref:Transcriptional regulator n=1 Tax=Glycomyces terrestris TaxID=2493553 RepID=A0A426V2Y1_9ACTN|nr:metalloregulator ArsR/SmtB family transcription factor [Glycomyces terrestris]RRS01216.1 transcriptional regulator [Glycomyces terrestris]